MATHHQQRMCKAMLAAGMQSADYWHECSHRIRGYPIWRGGMTRSTRSVTTSNRVNKSLSHLYFNDSGIAHIFDYFETGCASRPREHG